MVIVIWSLCPTWIPLDPTFYLSARRLTRTLASLWPDALWDNVWWTTGRDTTMTLKGINVSLTWVRVLFMPMICLHLNNSVTCHFLHLVTVYQQPSQTMGKANEVMMKIAACICSGFEFGKCGQRRRFLALVMGFCKVKLATAALAPCCRLKSLRSSHPGNGYCRGDLTIAYLPKAEISRSWDCVGSSVVTSWVWLWG